MNIQRIKEFLRKRVDLELSAIVNYLVTEMSIAEKVIFFGFFVIFFLSGFALLLQVNDAFLVDVPVHGGTLTEGVIGTPRFVNPVLATTDADKDLTSLVYSGLLKVSPSGTLIPDLAETYTISSDGKTYTVTLKPLAYFHDNTPVTADDVIFTIEKIKDASIKSPRFAAFSSVDVEKVDDRTITFTLKQPYSPFIQNLTVGILPKHIWKNVEGDEFAFSQWNTKPIGSGPYIVESIDYTSSGLPSAYHLTSFKKYVDGQSFISTVVIKNYQNEKDLLAAYDNSDIDAFHGTNYDALSNIRSTSNVSFSPLPRVFGVFFNANEAPVLLNSEVRQALDRATDRNAIVSQILGGYGQAIHSPIPPTTIATSTIAFSQDTLEAARAILTSHGWKLGEDGIFTKTDSKKKTTRLTFSLSTSDAPELKAVATMLQQQWKALGADVDIKIFEVGDLNQNIIRPRKYDLLLFGEVIGRDMDLYPFWHSKERLDPGLNIALYTNAKVDTMLETLRETTDESKKQALHQNITQEIQNDTPAIFLYAPYFVYVLPDTVHNTSIENITQASDRFAGIHEWYMETDRVWKLFTHTN